MADFMSKHIAEREVSAAAQPGLHVLVEGEVEIELAVGRTVEGTHRGLAVAAGGRRGA